MLEERPDLLRPAKRQRLDLVATQALDEKDASLVKRHPLGVRPSGNALTAERNCKTACGPFARLPDELLSHLLESLDASALLRLGAGCRQLHAFTRNEELWKALFIESSPKGFAWKGTWRSTFLQQSSCVEPVVDCSNVFSDLLHRPFFCTHVSLENYGRDVPQSNQITRLSDLSPEDFQATWFSKPFILTAPVKEWPMSSTWSFESLRENYADVAFRAESVDWPLRTYLTYMTNSSDESPLYLFDRSFAEKMNLRVTLGPSPEADYWPATCFGFDAFSVLGEQRPDHRWLIIGPARSGSTFHKDPNATSAWNAVITGSKYWIMFPSSPNIPPPPGVYVSEDQSEVTSPLSIAEWLLGFHAEARRSPGCCEGICNAGEVLHVPSGWYHLVLNLEPSIAITQNFVPRARVGAVLHFLKEQKQSISGFQDSVSDAFQLFHDRLEEYDPALLEEGMHELSRLSKGVKGKWEELTKTETTADEPAGFSFGFEADDEDADVP
ncbi:hypothetical protein LTR95_010584 [Oleoguttula sp. CCFEE 5521]